MYSTKFSKIKIFLPLKVEEEKEKLSKAITKAIVEITDNEEKAVSIIFEEITPEDWPEKYIVRIY